MSKQQKIIDAFISNPTANVKHVATKFRTAINTVYTLRKRAMYIAQERNATEVLGPQVESPAPKARDLQVGGDHYKNMGVEPWDVIDTWSTEQRIGYYRGNALKYIMRMGSKDVSADEIAKGKHYMQKLLEVLSNEDHRA